MPARGYLKDNRLAAIMATKRSAGFTPEENPRQHVPQSNSPGMCRSELIVLMVTCQTYTLFVPLVVDATMSGCPWFACKFSPWEHSQTCQFYHFPSNLVTIQMMSSIC